MCIMRRLLPTFHRFFAPLRIFVDEENFLGLFYHGHLNRVYPREYRALLESLP